jgi:hypothetical protein
MWKYIKLYLFGRLPGTVRYEQKQILLKEQYRRYEELRETASVKRYYELSAQVATPRRQSGLSKNEHKALKLELAALRKDANVAQFFKLQKKTHNFKEILQWDEFFYEDFCTAELDPQKWITYRCAAIEQLPEIQYSLAEENHILTTDGQNLRLTGDSLQVLTKKEPAEGLVFSRDFGFIEAKRNFTSGIINTGDTCRLIYGKVEVKFRVRSASKHVYHAIWMSGGQRLPHINLLRIGKKLEFGEFALTDSGISQHTNLWSKRLVRPNTYYILRLLWNKDRIEWYINGKKMFAAPNVIHEPLFLAFSSGATGREQRSKKESVLEVKWVKMASMK